MSIYVEMVESMTKVGTKVDKISHLSGLDISEIRKIMLENNIYPCVKDKEYKYFKDALLLKKHEKDAYFYKDLSKITGISLNRVKFIVKIYDIKPCKKAVCIVCGQEIDLSKSKIVNKYCSRRCSDKNNRPKKDKRVIIKHCVYCAKTFEGKPNSKYCSDFCKKMYNEVEDTIRWLRG